MLRDYRNKPSVSDSPVSGAGSWVPVVLPSDWIIFWKFGRMSKRLWEDCSRDGEHVLQCTAFTSVSSNHPMIDNL